MVNHPEWFKDVSINYMDESERLQEIKKYFLKLKEAHNWCLDNFPSELGLDPSGNETPEQDKFLTNKLLPAVENIYVELEKLGVDKTFSACLFIMGGLVTQKLVDQFKNTPQP